LSKTGPGAINLARPRSRTNQGRIGIRYVVRVLASCPSRAFFLTLSQEIDTTRGAVSLYLFLLFWRGQVGQRSETAAISSSNSGLACPLPMALS
jgi:hypothetical protein